MTDIHPAPVLGIIGGSGLYDLEGLEDIHWQQVKSPWGDPSDELLRGRLDGVQMIFLPRHGRGHRLSPSSINYRANIDALKRVGVTDIISLSAVGSFRDDLAPGTFVIVDQFIDRTFAREKSFLAPVWSPTCRWHVRSTPDWVTGARPPAGIVIFQFNAAEYTLPWRAHSFRLWPNQISIDNGAVM